MFRIKPIRLTAVLTLTLFFFVFFIFFSDFTLSKEEEDNLVKKNKIGQSLKMSLSVK
jgi:dolichyl-phosphate-mannose--protein O-mannosyl transferase